MVRRFYWSNFEKNTDKKLETWGVQVNLIGKNFHTQTVPVDLTCKFDG